MWTDIKVGLRKVRKAQSRQEWGSKIANLSRDDDNNFIIGVGRV